MSDPGVSPGEVGGVFAGVIAGLVAIGKGAGWLLNFRESQAESRHKKLQLWHRELEERERALDAQQLEYWRKIEGELKQVQVQNKALRMSFELVAAQLRIHDPHNPAFMQADQLLTAAFPLDAALPLTFEQLLGKVDQAVAEG